MSDLAIAMRDDHQSVADAARTMPDERRWR